MEEGLAQLAGEQRLWQIPEKLLHHVCHVVRRLLFVVDVVRRSLVHLPESLNSRLHARFAKETHLQVKPEEWMMLTPLVKAHATRLHSITAHCVAIALLIVPVKVIVH